ncbi:MAG: hypothetical protein M0C28_03690 [Candidatus Moduliflexus flocculans]|nr:hypothetical protein [Candidatus Moduliflexus flocculans]
MKSHLPSASPACFAAAAAMATTEGGRPARSALSSMIIWKAFVSARTFSPNLTDRDASSWLSSRRRAFPAASRIAPPRTKSL